MLREKLDLSPQENFYQIFGTRIWSGEFPLKSPASSLWTTLVFAGVTALVALPARNALSDPALGDPVMAVMWILLAVLLALCVLFSIRPLAEKMPGAVNWATGFGGRCVATALYVLAAFMAVGSFAGEIMWEERETGETAAAAVVIVLYILSSDIVRLVDLSLMARRIREGCYRPRVNIKFGITSEMVGIRAAAAGCAVSMAGLLLVLVLRAIGSIAGLLGLDFMDWDMQPAINVLASLVLFFLALAVNVAVAFVNARQYVLGYAYRRFKDSLDGFAPVDDGEEEPEEDNEE